MNQTTVSVIIPIYNTEEYLAKCLESVLKQSLKEIEIICINDCSKDESEKIINRYKEQDERIIYKINEKNMGLSYSRNIGIQCAKGEYIFFLDSDDYIKKNTLYELYNYSKKMEMDILYFGYYDIQINGLCIKKDRESIYPNIMGGKEFFCDSIEKNNAYVMSWSAFYNRNFIVKNEISFENDMIFEDNIFYFQTLMKAKRVSSLEKCYYYYKRRNNSIISSNENLQKKLMSECRMINILYKYIEQEQDERLVIDIDKLIENESVCLIDFYKNIDYFDMSEVDRNIKDYIILSIVKGKIYNGYFKYKLPRDVLEKIKNYDNVVIYGAGKIGQGLYELLLERNIKVSCFSETKNTGNKKIKDILIKPIDEINRNSLILIAISKKRSSELINYANELEFKYILDVSLYA